jgi:hypothetical protein
MGRRYVEIKELVPEQQTKVVVRFPADGSDIPI